jgi:glucose-6-phosphate-specific signal transduction histidine kinase
MPLLADIVWPAIYLTIGLRSLASIVSGLLCEYLFVRFATPLRGVHAVGVTILMNLLSTCTGAFLIPLAGLGWEFLAHHTYNSLMDWGTFNPVTWGATVLIAAMINVVIEGLTLRYLFRVVLGVQQLLLLFAVNMVSVGIAFVQVYFDQPQL